VTKEDIMDRLENSRRRLNTDVQSVLGDVDDILTALRMESAGTITQARANYDAAVQRARIRIAQTKAVAKARSLRAVGEAEVFAHQHPWRTAGMALATGAAVGTLIGILSARKRH
jgi:ElaB/YqjD/DUF883 family membrane-anchored ribosome-binding protein